MPGAAGGAGLADDGEGDVLGGDAGRQHAVDGDAHVLGLLLDQRLGREHMLDLGRADAVGEGAKGAMRRGVAVTADDGHAGEGETLFRADDVDDALPAVEFIEVLDAELASVLGHGLDLQPALGIVDAVAAVGGGDVVVDHRQRPLGRAHRAVAHPQAFEGLGAGHFMHEVPVDINKRGAVRIVGDQVVVPDLVVKRAAFAHFSYPA